jgi:predicted transcriptional regulator
MDEVQEFCVRVLGPGGLAEAAAVGAHAAGSGDRVALLADAARACRERAELQGDHPQQEDQGGADSPGLAAAVAKELALATAKLPERQREALALRELLGLSHAQISEVMGIEPPAVAPLLARARLRLRSERRGTESEPGADCAERERALRVLACRQDSEPLSNEDDVWLLEHLGTCGGCEMAHAAMLEASVCYRAWPRA